jgi:hypothetical protein
VILPESKDFHKLTVAGQVEAVRYLIAGASVDGLLGALAALRAVRDVPDCDHEVRRRVFRVVAIRLAQAVGETEDW